MNCTIPGDHCVRSRLESRPARRDYRRASQPAAMEGRSRTDRIAASSDSSAITIASATMTLMNATPNAALLEAVAQHLRLALHR